jgi:cob(I)alamin adenosyltransferase
MILILTGNGKGKTTSAIGCALRASGWQKRVAIVFFDKGGSHYGEQNIFNFLQQKIDVFRFGLPRFDEKKKEFRFANSPADQREAANAIKKTNQLFNKKYFLIVLDEIISVLNLKLIIKEDVQKLLDSCPKATHLILTGSNAPLWLKKRADLITEMREQKHYFKKGIKAIKGLDY